MPKPIRSRSARPEPVEGPISPGTYLRKRRKAAFMTLADVAQALGNLPAAIRPPTAGDIALLHARLKAAEDDRGNITLPQAALLTNVFRFDPGVYEALLLLHYDQVGTGLPVPQLCRACACSWHDPCRIPIPVTRLATGEDVGFAVEPCEWAGPDLCTACAAADRRAAPPETLRPVEGAPA